MSRGVKRRLKVRSGEPEPPSLVEGSKVCRQVRRKEGREGGIGGRSYDVSTLRKG